ncbi:MAG: VWA domain-containing protein [Candidatus Riflebacteria bacterium]|nr:VWA domain-containing protein [Candidatus Riflebacteria bacterium]
MKRLLACSMFLLIVAPARSTGVLVTDRGPLAAVSHEVRIKSATQIARTILTQRFENRSGSPIKGTYVFPIPPLATLVGLADVTAGQYRPVPLSVREKLPPAAPSGQPAPAPGADAPVSEPCRNPVTGSVPLAGFELMAKVLDQRGVRLVQCPGQRVDARLDDKGFWNITHRAASLPASAEFVIEYALSESSMNAVFVGGEDERSRGASTKDRYILALLSPREDDRLASGSVEVKPAPATTLRRREEPKPRAETRGKGLAAKEIAFLLDVSGSMAGEKLDQAKAAFLKCIERLNPQDRFNVISFNDKLEPLWPSRRLATEENRKLAADHVDQLSDHGSTNLFGALEEGLANLDRAEGGRYLYLITDGQPTVGLQDEDEIVKQFHTLNRREARLFTFGIGDDVSRSLLDRLALRSRGDAVYTAPDSRIDSSVTESFQKISKPLLLDPRVAFDGLPVAEVYPETLEDVNQGSQVVVVARVTGRMRPGAAMVLTGRIGSQAYTYRFPIAEDLTREVSRAVPRLWARGKIDHLSRQLRMAGRSDALRKELIAVGSKFDLQTPFTRYSDPATGLPSPTASVPFRLSRAFGGMTQPDQGLGPSGSPVTVSDVPVERPKPYRWRICWGIPRLLEYVVYSAHERANIRACFANQRTVAGAMEMYSLDKRVKCTRIDSAFWNELKRGGYLQSIPQDPGAGAGSSSHYQYSPKGSGVRCTVHGQATSDEPGRKDIELINADGSRTLHPLREVPAWWHPVADVVSLLVDLLLVLVQLWLARWLWITLGSSARAGVKATPA